jgi:aspartate 1-decarboxylase
MSGVLISFLYSKIHRATVTDADLDYVGSITIDRTLMDGARLVAGQRVQIADVDTGARLDTYVIPGEPGSGVIGMNGAAARLVHVGDVVIIMSYAQGSVDEARAWQPAVVHVDARNHRIRLGHDPAEPPTADLQRPPHSEPAVAGRR